MALTYKVLAQGQLPNAAGVLYTVPAGTSAIVKQIALANTDGAATHNATIYVNGTGAGNQILPVTTLPINGSMPLTGTITLAAGQTIQGLADAASKITYTIFGVEIT